MFIETVPNRNSPPAILLREGRARPHGHVAAVLDTLRTLALERLIAPQRSPERDRVVALVVARVLDPSSKLATARGLAEATARDSLAETLDLGAVDEDDLYAAMDWLRERQERIERGLAKRHLAQGALVLYDLTSVSLEGRRCPLAKRGYSREGKKGKLQIEFGLLCDRDGCPVAVEVFPGNTADPATVGPQLKKLRERFGLSRGVLVGDRGMLSEARIREELEPAGLDWVSALRGPASRKLLKSGAVQLSLFDEKALVEVRSEAYPGERLMVCRNPLLADERARKRESLLEATEKWLEPIAVATRREKHRLKDEERIGERVGKVIGKHKMAKHFAWSLDAEGHFTYPRNAESIAAEAALDGLYVVRTSVAGSRTRCPRHGACLQAPEQRRARLAQPQERRAEGAPGLPPHRRTGACPRAGMQARLLRGMAHAPALGGAVVRRRRPRGRRGRPRWHRGAGESLRIRPPQGRAQAHRRRNPCA